MIFKYADDTYLIVSDIFSRTILKNCNTFLISTNTSTSAATFLTRVDSSTVLGVTFNSKLRFDLHVSTCMFQILLIKLQELSMA